jgi:hypothetical protein
MTANNICFICKTDLSKPVKQEVNGTMILPLLVIPAFNIYGPHSRLCLCEKLWESWRHFISKWKSLKEILRSISFAAKSNWLALFTNIVKKVLGWKLTRPLTKKLRWKHVVRVIRGLCCKSFTTVIYGHKYVSVCNLPYDRNLHSKLWLS